MPSWNDLLEGFQRLADNEKSGWLIARMNEALREIGRMRGDRNVILYGSAFLQKPQAPQSVLSITHEDLNGLMSVMYGMDWSKGLTLILHTPGGVTNAAESLVAYLRSKFESIETIVPGFAMSAGTMVALGSDRIVMGRQSQLGPIDPQMPVGSRYISARAVVEQFERAVREIIGTDEAPGDLRLAHVWAPILQTMGPSLLQEAQNALDYGESMVARWLATWMLRDDPDPETRGAAIAKHFNDASRHKSHGRRIDRQEAADQLLHVEELEASQELQEWVLTCYHVMTIVFEQSPSGKVLWSSHERTWLKNLGIQVQPAAPS